MTPVEELQQVSAVDDPLTTATSSEPSEQTPRGRLTWHRRKGGRSDLTPRRYLVPPALLMLGATLWQDPGKIVADTKVAVVLNPGRFLGSALHLWNPLQDTGSIGNQSTGYLVPMGPFFLLTHALRIPPAVAQRLWLSLLLVVGFWGLVRLADALGIGNRWGRVLGGMAYALSPVVLSRIGDNSTLLLGYLLLPWVLLPLVRATYRIPETGPPYSARRAAALSGCAVLLTGGINATVTLNMLIVPTVWLILMCRGRGAWILRAWWVAAVICATAWWVIPLKLLGQYGVNFVPYTESANTTTSVSSLPETIRGTADWLDYFRVGGAGLPSGWTYISATVAIIASFVLAGVGLAGLGRIRVPARRFLVSSLAIGVVAVAAAYAGSPHGLLADSWRHALTGPLGALRNINKFQPLIRLPLALGLANCLPILATRGVKRFRWPRRFANVTTAGVLAGAIVIGAAPLGLGRLYQPGSFAAVPSYWQQAADFLAKSSDGTRTLLVPGSGFGSYTWGDPADEPMLWLAQSPWAVRDIIPLGGVNSTRWLDGIEQQLGQRATPSLAATLARAGFGYVLVRNDLVKQNADTPPSTDEVHTALTESGLRRVAAFGPLVTGRRTAIQTFLKQPPTPGRYPSLEIYALPGANRVDAYPASSLAVLSGGPEALPTLAASGVLGNRPTVLAADLAAGSAGDATLPVDLKPSAWIDTDTLTRRDQQYGSLHGGASYLLAPGAKAAGESTAPQVRLDVNANGHQTTALLTGIQSVNASNYGFVLGAVPQAGPESAIDGDPNTSWSVSGYPRRNVGQWLQVSFPKPISANHVSVQLLNDSSKRIRITSLRVTTDAGSLQTKVGDTAKSQVLELPSGPTKTLRLTITSVTGGAKSGSYGPGISELTIPGVTIGTGVALPNDAARYFPAGGPSSISYVFSRDRADPQSSLDLDVESQIARTFTVPRTEQFHPAGTVVDRNPVPPTSKGAIVDLACGSGPSVSIDGKEYATYVRGDRADLAAGQPVPLGICASGPVTLKAGQHTVSTSPSSSPLYRPSLGIATLTLSSLPTATLPPNRSVTVTKWGSETRQVKVAAGAQSILTVHENFNKSWHATANGKRLTPIRIDGWQQGFIVPAGAATTVNLVNTPGQIYRIGLLVSAALVLLLLIAAAWPSKRQRAIRPPRTWGLTSRRAAALALACLTTLLVAGPIVMAIVPVLALAIWLIPRVGPLLAIAGIAVAGGVTLAHQKAYAGSGHGAFSSTAQIAVALAVAATILSLGLRTSARAVSNEEPADASVAETDHDGRLAEIGDAMSPVAETATTAPESSQDD